MVALLIPNEHFYCYECVCCTTTENPFHKVWHKTKPCPNIPKMHTKCSHCGQEMIAYIFFIAIHFRNEHDLIDDNHILSPLYLVDYVYGSRN